MTGINDIITEVKRLMVIKYPKAQAYLNICPVSYVRPSYLIRCPKFDQTDVNRSTVEIVANLTISYFTDSSDLTGSTVMSEEQQKILGIFRDGYITIGDRKIKVKASAGNVDYNEANVDLQFEYFDDRSDATDNTPKMGTVTTNTKLI